MASLTIPKLGIAEIDEQHSALVACVERLEMWSRKGQDFAAALDAITALSDYASEHFSYEEDLLRRHGYPKLDEQIAEHREFSRQLARLTEQLLSEEVNSRQVITFVEQWVSTHIGEEDAAFAKYLAHT